MADPSRVARTYRQTRGFANRARGVVAEDAACAALIAQGWQIHGRRLRTKAGEVDAVAEKNGLLAIIEVKSRTTLAQAAFALDRRQMARLIGAAAILLAENPSWGAAGVRFDVIIVDRQLAVQRIEDAFRVEN